MKKPAKTVTATKHENASRKNIPTAEYESLLHEQDKRTVRVAYPRNRDLDPQLVWRGKDEQDQAELIVEAAPIYL